MPTTRQGQLPLSTKLSPAAQSAFVLDDLQTGTLISLAQLCDDDCIAIFNRYEVKILKDNEVIIQGKRMPNGLWSLPIQKIAPHQANGILCTDKPKQELAAYLHATLGSPASSTLLGAIRRGHLTTIPGLTTNLIYKHLSKSIATTLGHQDQEAKHLRSTHLPIPASLAELSDTDLAPPLDTKSHQNILIKPANSRSPPVEVTIISLFSIITIRTPFRFRIAKLPAFVVLGNPLTKNSFNKVILQISTFWTTNAPKS
jgi:hypothetical protein